MYNYFCSTGGLLNTIGLCSSEQSKNIRQSYNDSITATWNKKFKKVAYHAHAEGREISEEEAREAYSARSDIKKSHQQETPIIEKYSLYTRNLWKYGESTGPKFDDLVKKGKSPEEIFYSAFKTDGGDLGLNSNNFESTLMVTNWLNSADHSSSKLYPEDIKIDYFTDICGDLSQECVQYHYHDACFGF